jgi:peptide methionine sulfoxide reductase msrA/msrB
MQVVTNETREIYLGGGCFWGVEHFLAGLKGVVATEVGYANGSTSNPTYEQVCRENTGHAEVVKVEYDPLRISLPFLLEMFFSVIDPTSVNKQGNDVGSQYRTGIYYSDVADLPVIRESVAKLAAEFSKPLAIEVEPLSNYYSAEQYHQKYLVKNPGGYCHIGGAAFARAAQAVDPLFQTALGHL